VLYRRINAALLVSISLVEMTNAVGVQGDYFLVMMMHYLACLMVIALLGFLLMLVLALKSSVIVVKR